LIRAGRRSRDIAEERRVRAREALFKSGKSEFLSRVTYGIYSNWIEETDELLKFLSSGPFSDAHRQAVVRGLPGPAGNGCSGAKELGDQAIKRLEELARANLGD
jgi:hypothetical protein